MSSASAELGDPSGGEESIAASPLDGVHILGGVLDLICREVNPCIEDLQIWGFLYSAQEKC